MNASEGDGALERLPAVYLAVSWLENLPAMVGLVVAGSIAGQWTGPSWVVRLIWLLFLLRILMPVFTWATFRYRVSEDLVCVSSGLFQRRTRSASWEQVSTVQLDCPWAYRPANVVRVALLQAGNVETSILIPCVRLEVADQMLALAEVPLARAAVTSGGTADDPKSCQASPGPTPVADPDLVALIYKASMGDLLIASLIYGRFAVLGGAIAVAVFQELQTWGLDDEARRLAAGSPIAGGVLIAIVILGAGMFATVIRYAGLQTTSTRSGGIRIQYGMFSTRQRVLTPGAICGIELRRSPLELALGRVRLSIASTDSSDRLGSNLVLPSLSEEVAERIVASSFDVQRVGQDWRLPRGRRPLLLSLSAFLVTASVALASAWLSAVVFRSASWLAVLVMLSAFAFARSVGVVARTRLHFDVAGSTLSAITTWISARHLVVAAKYVHVVTTTKLRGFPTASRIHYYAGRARSLTAIGVQPTVISELAASIAAGQFKEEDASD